MYTCHINNGEAWHWFCTYDVITSRRVTSRSPLYNEDGGIFRYQVRSDLECDIMSIQTFCPQVTPVDA